MTYIIVTGPKHSGKTLAGRELARLLSCPFVDLDELIEERSGRSPRRLYGEGPETFRREEAAALAALLRPPETEKETKPEKETERDGGDGGGLWRGVIAAGGGLADNPAALALLGSGAPRQGPEEAPVQVFLEVSARAAWERITAAGELPPFLRAESPEEARNKHRALHQRRTEMYRRAAALTVAAEGKSPGEIAGEIRDRLAAYRG